MSSSRGSKRKDRTADFADGADEADEEMGKLLHEELSGSIIGAAMHVLNELKPGLDEKVYERALVIELIARGHKVDQQRRFDVLFRGT